MDTTHISAIAGALRRQRFTAIDAVIAAALVATFFFAELYLALAVSVLIMIILALSLDLAQGYAGIETLGHAAFFGSGAYAAGLYALHISTEPFSGLVVGAGAAAIVGALTGIAVLRTQGLTQIMLTLASATLLLELANVAKKVTMGDDGLTGYSIAPLLGRFEFDIQGRTAYVYAAVVLVLVYIFAKYFVNSPLGLTAQGIRENPVRMRMLGVRVYARLLAIYTISAAVAGIAGALSAQVNRIVGLDALGFTLSANVLVMLALGGTGRLYGAFIGAVLFMLLSDRAAAVDPTNWLAALGVLLILAVRFAPDGLMGLIERFAFKPRREAAKSPNHRSQAR
ncbi:branched-chain amino acid ABC transporter permease [Verminephrobacter eiseniae]|uniref:branched-chain amino acid ABC transporter permease n=1 Tax=Verminephrobacter eiseniae TaxID=364317 RepID=UPI002237B809|nr:branched-chain amino acid ABC transporter permease [Verminephrobacter eiseniae]MCW5234218.1 branched-chain amino acid ABC transporter permease [Verminephrobacter eiseniae]MCW5294226.1 branched-chain amino acid ABC transporter permease [Verminephrobacter eiseniae]MCW8185032.1 branched-chain amino acid ABC transporter permease [Verminephrobacter eiseniae]MCW8223931.1 branched-chain amino acid ABC transporter permease [Verminephrobacter eiseniae]